MADQSQEHTLFIGARAALISGVVVGVVVIGSQLLIGQIYSKQEARDLVAAMSAPVTSLAATILSGLATVLALMLAMLSLSHWFEQSLHKAFYRRIQMIAFLSIVGMIVAIVLLLVLSSPIQEATTRTHGSTTVEGAITYYILIALTALLAGLFVAIIVMLFNAVQTVIQVVRPDE